MKNNNEILFDILKNALWSKEFYRGFTPEEVQKELQLQTVEGLTCLVLPSMQKEKYALIAKFVQMASMQTKIIRVLREAEIPTVIIKGTASGIYYPIPYLRTYGDIDILVNPRQYENAIRVLKQKGFFQQGRTGREVTNFVCNGYLIELHQSLSDLERINTGSYIREYILSGLEDIYLAEMSNPKCVFPMLPWKQNGLVLIWHIWEHLYGGLGLRQIIDWMMFVYQNLRDEEAFAEFSIVLEKAGMFHLAQVVTRMCQIYLGLEGDYSWCSEVNADVCRELMNYILEQGNFGNKRKDEKTKKVLARYHSPLAFMKGMQKRGMDNWKMVWKYPILCPFAWLYTAIEGIKLISTKEGRVSLMRALQDNHQQRVFFRKVYGDSILETKHREKKIRDDLLPKTSPKPQKSFRKK